MDYFQQYAIFTLISLGYGKCHLSTKTTNDRPEPS